MKEKSAKKKKKKWHYLNKKKIESSSTQLMIWVSMCAHKRSDCEHIVAVAFL